jgi:hypothetical protein
VRVKKDDSSRKGPLPVADDDEDDDTVVDVGTSSLAAMAHLGASSDDSDTELDMPALQRATPPPRPLPPALRSSAPVEARNFRGPSLPHLAAIADDDDDDDATHVLPRDDGPPSHTATPIKRDISDDGMLPSDEATARLPAPRRLDAVPRISPEEADDRTLSRPVLKRNRVVPSGEGSPARLLDEMGLRSTPKGRAFSTESGDDEHVVIASSKPAKPPVAEPSATPTTTTNDGEDDMGAFLVIDAPAGATVFVDGEEKGQGRTIVNGIDPHARFAIRVHKAGYKPWSGTTSLDGMREAIVRPTLKKRD